MEIYTLKVQYHKHVHPFKIMHEFTLIIWLINACTIVLTPFLKWMSLKSKLVSPQLQRYNLSAFYVEILDTWKVTYYNETNLHLLQALSRQSLACNCKADLHCKLEFQLTKETFHFFNR